ncbi:adenylate kinase [Pyrofollis japonicus]|uniref:adenylate kinase n=1 Tax=Pyrofollis japonicus TaxID=3060460 RepID=UPI00295BE4B9|nr:adenylate kinase [Pyrofollis japonicus]BEP17512.1 adenylate kinase [Pyrofollis japonicus]
MVRRNPFTTIIVTGVPGVGKTTVLNNVRALLDERGRKYMIVNFGDYMFKVASMRGLVKHRDELRHLPLLKQLELQEYAAEAIRLDAEKTLNGGDILFVDTHAVIRTDTGYWPGLPENVVKALQPDSIVVIEAPPEVIVKRQQRDPTRYRADLSRVEIVSELLQMARIAAMASAVHVAASVFIVENVEGDPTIAANKVVELATKLR